MNEDGDDAEQFVGDDGGDPTIWLLAAFGLALLWIASGMLHDWFV